MAALSNKDRVGRGLDLLAQGLLPFVASRMEVAAGGAGGDWVRLLQARDAAKHGRAVRHNETDPALLLRVLTEEWRVFKDDLSRVEQSFAWSCATSATGTRTTRRSAPTTPTGHWTRWSGCSRRSAPSTRPSRSGACAPTTSAPRSRRRPGGS